jgi:hypothetical protein
VADEIPVVLELAPLPREQLGPFLLLGVDKDAAGEPVEAAWARRLIWARKGQFRLPLEDINWAREILRDPDRRLQADRASLNPDLVDGVLRRLAQRYGLTDSPAWHPAEVEKDLSAFTPEVAVPDPDEVRRDVPRPAPPAELPAVPRLLDRLAAEPLDPWDPALIPDPEQEPDA